MALHRKKKFPRPPYTFRGPLRGGFTLLEVMIAMAILSISLLVVFQSQSQSVAMMANSRAMTMLTLLAQSKMAELETAAIASLESGSGDFGADYPDYTWTSTVTSEDERFLKKIVLKVQNNRLKKGNAITIVLYRFKT
jgi:general secretion pathway protein I